jgi:hypothetical protein
MGAKNGRQIPNLGIVGLQHQQNRRLFACCIWKHLTEKLKDAGIHPEDSEVFGNFLKLILIAVLVGWVWSRF